MTRFKHILLPTDFSDAARPAEELAVEFALSIEAKLTLVHVWSVPDLAYVTGAYWGVDKIQGLAGEALEAKAREIRARLPGTDWILRSGETWQEIIAAASAGSADLIVMGTHGRHGMAHAMLGSVAERVVRASPVPVLTVRGRG
jgi:nucleotide-binding universal stress UspA family protein